MISLATAIQSPLTPLHSFARSCVDSLRALDRARTKQHAALPAQRADRTEWNELQKLAETLGAAQGFDARWLCGPMTVARIWLPGCLDLRRGKRRLQALACDLLQIGVDALPDGCAPIGSIPMLNLRDDGDAGLEVLLSVEGATEFGWRALAEAAHAIAPRAARLAEGRGEPDIQLEVVETERVSVRCPVTLRDSRTTASPPASERRRRGHHYAAALDVLIRQFGIDRHQPALAAVHNLRVIEGLTLGSAALHIASDCIPVAARSHAARWGSCEHLVKWRRRGDALFGELSCPIDVQSVHDGLSRGSREPVSVQTARELSLKVATIGLAASLAHLRSVLRVGSTAPSEAKPRVSEPKPRPTNSRSPLPAATQRVLDRLSPRRSVRQTGVTRAGAPLPGRPMRAEAPARDPRFLGTVEAPVRPSGG